MQKDLKAKQFFCFIFKPTVRYSSLMQSMHAKVLAHDSAVKNLTIKLVLCDRTHQSRHVIREDAADDEFL